MTNKTIFIKLFCFAILLLTVSNCEINSEHNKEIIIEPNQTKTGAGDSITRPADEGKVEIFIPEYEITETNLEYLQSLPTPKFEVIFEQNNSTVEPSSEVKQLLNEHWKAAIKFFYQESFEKPENAQDFANRIAVWFNYCSETHQKIKKLKIIAPYGERTFSETESSEFTTSLNKEAVNVINKVKAKNSDSWF